MTGWKWESPSGSGEGGPSVFELIRLQRILIRTRQSYLSNEAIALEIVPTC